MSSPTDGRASVRTAIVTGAAGGIGRVVTARLAAGGHNVVAVDRDQEALDRLSADLSDKVLGVRADLASAESRSTVVPAALERFGRVDVLINNAADHGSRVPFLEVPAEEWARVIDTNLTASAMLAQEAARDMVTRHSGVIINITAVQERLPLTTYAAYGASKGGVSALTRSLAVELGPYGIRVNAIAPGMISTENLAAAKGGAQDSTQESPTLLGHDGTPDDIAAAVDYLISDGARFVTGTILTVDGGRVISRKHDPLADRFAAGTEARS